MNPKGGPRRWAEFDCATMESGGEWQRRPLALRRKNSSSRARIPMGKFHRECFTMTRKWNEQDRPEDFWYSGKVTRRRLVGWGAGVIGTAMLVPAPWRASFGAAAKPYKIGSLQPLSGAGGARGKTPLVGAQMAGGRHHPLGGRKRPPGAASRRPSRTKTHGSRPKAGKLAVGG